MSLSGSHVALLRRLFLLAGFAAALAVFGLTPGAALAGPVFPYPVTFTQPDGATFTAIPYGDERSSGYETVAGQAIVREAASGTWYLAVADGDGRDDIAALYDIGSGKNQVTMHAWLSTGGEFDYNKGDAGRWSPAAAG